MARLVTSGGEIRDHPTSDIGSPDGVSGGAAATTTETTIVRSGAASIKCPGTSSSSAYRYWPFTGASGTGYYGRAWIRVSALPSATKQVVSFVTAADGALVSARLTSAGKLQLWNDTGTPAQIGSDSTATVNIDNWYRVELYLKIAAGAADETELRVVDAAEYEFAPGTTVASGTGLTISDTAPGKLRVGWLEAPGVTSDMFVDDVALNNSSGSADNSWAGQGRIVLLAPSRTNNRFWTNCAGEFEQASDQTGVMRKALDNTPPDGIADHVDASHSAAPHQIRTAPATTTTPTDWFLNSYARVARGNVFTPGAQTTGDAIGSSSTVAKLASGFYMNSSLDYVEVPLKRTNSPTDNVILEIVSGDSDKPSSTVVATSDPVAASSIPTTTTWIRFDLTKVALTEGARYWIVMSRSGSFDATNRVSWLRAATSGSPPTQNQYPDRMSSLYNSGTGVWSAGSRVSEYYAFRLFSIQGFSEKQIVQPLVCHAAASGSPSGTLESQQDPVIAAESFTFGDGAGAAGTYPTNWRWYKATPTRQVLTNAGVGPLLRLTRTDTTAATSVGSLATANHKTSASTWNAATTTAQLDAGNAVVLVLATDNTATTDGDNNEHTGVSVGSLALTKAREFTNAQGAAAAGVTTSVWYGKAASNIASGATITCTFASARAAKALTAWEFTVAAGTGLSVADGKDLADDGVDLSSLASATLPSSQYIFVRGSGQESPTTTYTPSFDFTAFTHTSSTTTGGSAATNISARGEFWIAEATSATTDPTGAGAVDGASVLVAIRQDGDVSLAASLCAYLEYLNPDAAWAQYTKTSDSTLWWAKQAIVDTDYECTDGSTVTVTAGDSSLYPDPLPAEDELYSTSLTTVTAITLRADYTPV